MRSLYLPRHLLKVTNWLHFLFKLTSLSKCFSIISIIDLNTLRSLAIRIFLYSWKCPLFG